MKNLITFFTQSSEDPTKTSAVLTGILIALASYIQQAGEFMPVISAFYESPLGKDLSPILTAIGMIFGGIWFLFGIFRKLTNKVEEKVLDNYTTR